VHAGQNNPCHARGKLRTNHGDGAVYDWGQRSKKKEGKERRTKPTDGMNAWAWMDGDCFGSSG